MNAVGITKQALTRSLVSACFFGSPWWTKFELYSLIRHKS